jgi:hypothetical protein
MSRRRKPPNRGGRPLKLTTPTVVRLTAALLDRESFEAAGIGQSTLYRWLAKAKAGDPRFGPLNDVVRRAQHAREVDSAFSHFSLALLKAGL